jgi:hypothetical protein
MRTTSVRAICVIGLLPPTITEMRPASCAADNEAKSSASRT